MCGIAGYISKSQVGESEKKIVQSMTDALFHRGPNGEGFYGDEKIMMEMRRLSIIDLNGGWQPIFNESEDVVVVCNGEIYNYIEIRTFLESRGHKFKTHSDVEVIVHLYEEKGIALLDELRGMYAFCLYDKKKQEVIIARDRIGEKPLYLFETDNELIFSSEMKSLLSSGKVNLELNEEAIKEYFFYQYVPEPKTPIKNVRKLPAGSYIKINLINWKTEERVYWSFDTIKPHKEDPVRKVKEELNEIGKLIIRADVPIGVALSGGIDSSVIAALAKKHTNKTIHAFSVGYPNYPECDERKYAKKFADELGLVFHEVELKTEDLVNSFEEMNSFRDDPIADISGYGYYAVSKAAKDAGVPVLLQGQGGDELFWGYEWVKNAAIESNLLLMQKKFGILSMLFYLTHFCNDLTNIKLKIKSAVKLFLKHRKIKNSRLVFHELAPDFSYSLQHLNQFLTSEFKEMTAKFSPFKIFEMDSWTNPGFQVSKLISLTYLSENGIAQGDRLSMANSIELRIPLVDYKLVEIVMGARKNNSIKDFMEFPKPWLKKAVKDLVPEEILERPKRGFAPPVHEWHNALFEKYGSLIADGILFQKKVITRSAAEELSKGPFPPGTICPMSFKVLVLEMWLRSMNKIIKEAKSGGVL